MRAIYILSVLLIITLNGCATVEIAKEITKVGDSIKTTIQKAAKNQNNLEKTAFYRFLSLYLWFFKEITLFWMTYCSNCFSDFILVIK